MKAVLVFCEGPHDVAFLVRTLVATGEFRLDETKIGAFPKPMAEILIGQFKKHSAEDLEKTRPQRYANAPLPALSNALRYGGNGAANEVAFWFFCAFGQDQHKKVGTFIKGARDRIVFDREQGTASDISSLAFAFVYDADEDGEASKLKKFKNDYEIGANTKSAQLFQGLTEPVASGWQRLQDATNTEVGVYILHGQDRETGELEDIVLPLMRSHDDARYADAETFVKRYWNDANQKKQRKAIITIAGQTQQPGDSMAVILRESSDLGDDALNADSACQKLVRFFKEVCVQAERLAAPQG